MCVCVCVCLLVQSIFVLCYDYKYDKQMSQASLAASPQNEKLTCFHCKFPPRSPQPKARFMSNTHVAMPTIPNIFARPDVSCHARMYANLVEAACVISLLFDVGVVVSETPETPRRSRARPRGSSICPRATLKPAHKGPESTNLI